MAFADRSPGYLDRVERALERCLPTATTEPVRLHQAMRYAVLGGGKRVRPLLVFATAAGPSFFLSPISGDTNSIIESSSRSSMMIPAACDLVGESSISTRAVCALRPRRDIEPTTKAVTTKTSAAPTTSSLR